MDIHTCFIRFVCCRVHNLAFIIVGSQPNDINNLWCCIPWNSVDKHLNSCVFLC